MLFVCHPEILREHCLQFLLGVKMALRETENNAYAKFWGDKQKALWYVMVFSGVVNCKEDFFWADVGATLQVPFVVLFLLRVPALCHGSLTFQKGNLTNN